MLMQNSRVSLVVSGGHSQLCRSNYLHSLIHPYGWLSR